MRLIKLLMLMILLPLITSCSKDSDNIQGVIFDNFDNEDDNSKISIKYSIESVYESNPDGRFGPREIYGFDLLVTNNSDVELSNVSSSITYVSGSEGCDYNTSSDCIDLVDPDRVVYFYQPIYPNETKRGSNYYCLFCDTQDEIMVGNFYLVSAYLETRLLIFVTILITYQVDNENFQDEYTFSIDVY